MFRFSLLAILVVSNISLYIALAAVDTKVTELSLDYKFREAKHWQTISNNIQSTLDILIGVISCISCILMILTVLHIRKLSKIIISDHGV